MCEHQALMKHIQELHTTILGVERIKRNLHLDVEDVVTWCKQKVLQEGAYSYRRGKNWYVVVEHIIITINAHSYTIITAHIKKKEWIA